MEVAKEALGRTGSLGFTRRYAKSVVMGRRKNCGAVAGRVSRRGRRLCNGGGRISSGRSRGLGTAFSRTACLGQGGSCFSACLT